MLHHHRIGILPAVFYCLTVSATFAQTGAGDWWDGIGSDTTTGSKLGWTMAIDGDTAAFMQHGIPEAYVFQRSGPGSWNQVAKLSDPNAAPSKFGRGASISGDTIMIAGDDSSVYVYQKPGAGWSDMTLATYLLNTGNNGGVVDLEGNTAAIGGWKTPNTEIWQYDGANWTKAATLSFSDWGQPTPSGKSRTGSQAISVNEDGSTVIVGDFYANKGYVYVKPDGGWVDASETATLEHVDGSTNLWGVGVEVGISGGVALVTAYRDGPADNPTEGHIGRAYVFNKPDGGWASTTTADQVLEDPDGQVNDQFGHGGDISGDLIMIGTRNDGSGGGGTGFLFKRGSSESPFSQFEYLEHPLAQADPAYEFGAGLELDGPRAVFGIMNYDGGWTDGVGHGFIYEAPLTVRIPGDANLDGKVTDADAAILATNWQMMTGATWGDGDFNGDEKVTDADAAILATHWQEGAEAAAQAVPEPSTLVALLGIALAGLIARGRRAGR